MTFLLEHPPERFVGKFSPTSTMLEHRLALETLGALGVFGSQLGQLMTCRPLSATPNALRLRNMGRELEPPAWQRLRELQTPTLVVVGRSDDPDISYDR